MINADNADIDHSTFFRRCPHHVVAIENDAVLGNLNRRMAWNPID